MMEDLLPIAHRKKKVRYHELRDCRVGCPALVWPIDHPNIPVGAYAKTTIVQSFDPVTGVAETVNTRYEPGIFAQWSEMGEDTPFQLTYDLYTITPSMPAPLFAKVKVKETAQEFGQQSYFPHLPTAATLDRRQ
jgi:hypothetical protein